MRLAIIAGSLWLTALSPSSARDYERYFLEGYGVAYKTQVNGQFNGCNLGTVIRLWDGYIFICQTYAYHYAYSPEFLALKNVVTGQIKFLIDGDEYAGQYVRPQ